jgi:hypothetical protein
MKIRKILLYISILLLTSTLNCFSQGAKDEWRYEGPRVGVDLSRFTSALYGSGERLAWEVRGDYPIKGIWFPTVEIGMLQLEDKRDNYSYENNGMYGRLGVDLNILKFETLDDHDLLFVGARYGYSRYTHEAYDITYSNYWGESNTSVPENSLNAHWGELVFGMKGEVFRNLFLGWSFRVKFIMSKTADEIIDPFIIPGVGKTNVEIPMDFTYGVYYRIPVKKSKKIPKALKMGGAKNISDEVPQGNQMNMGGSGYY